MRLIAIAVLGLAAIAASTNASWADDGCGYGWYWNGYGCVQRYYAPSPYYAPPPRYEHRDYDQWRWRHHRHHHDWDDEDNDAPRFYNDGPRYYPPNPKWHTSNGCPPHFTVQDGLCKPYRGY